MEQTGLQMGFLLVQMVSLVVILGWIILVFYYLANQKRFNLSATEKALWTLIVLAIPLLGGLAFVLIKPYQKD